MLRFLPASDLGRSKDMSFLVGAGGGIVHGGDRGCYWPREERIQLPLPEPFRIGESKFATALHELSHWSGQMSRLDRHLTSRFGTAAYASDLLLA
jgi:antirestriction protein ArdC